MENLTEFPFELPTGTLNFNYSLFQNKCLGVVGKNGVGKSSFLKALIKASEEKIIDNDIIYCAQTQFTPISFITPGELLLVINHFSPENKVFDLIKKFEIDKLLNHEFSKLSGGEKQAFKLVSALGLKGKYIFLDEPTTYLDKLKQSVLISVLKELKLAGKSIIIVEHDLDFLKEICDEIMEIKIGDNNFLTMEKV